MKFDVLIHRSEWTRGTGAPGPRWPAGCVGGWDDRTSGIPPFPDAGIPAGQGARQLTLRSDCPQPLPWRIADPNPNETRTDVAVLEQDRDAAVPALNAGNSVPDPRTLAVAATLGEAEGVLEIDGTDIPNDGTESVGVARQYCGQLGQHANCQVAVCSALVDRRLYLNRDWVLGASHAARR